MDKLSIIIPSFNEPYLYETLNDILTKAKGEYEILVNIDGEFPKKFIENKKITYSHHPDPIGMRGGINLGIKNSTGNYIMKCDAHCLFDEGFNEILIKDMKKDWLIVPRRYSLYADGWKREMRMPFKDYHYISFPKLCRYGYGIFPQEWNERTIKRQKHVIDDTMTLQGSFWLADKDYFLNCVGYLNDSMDRYSTFSGEPLEVCLNYWLKGGSVKVNKKTWYAHLFKNKKFYGRHSKLREYKQNLKNIAGHNWAAMHWMNNEEPGIIHNMEWLIDKFWPVPTWPENWKELWKS